jgi:regulation of enolase protein 1 (concanavalin A-like superfamily)
MQQQSLWLMVGALAFAVCASPSAHAAAVAVPGAPAGWVHEDIGGPAAAGDSKVTGTGAAAVWTVTGSGSDIQGSADLFQYAYTPLMGDGGITARILTQTPGDPEWTKTGVMLRETDAAGSRMVTLNFTSNAGMEPGQRVDTDAAWTSPALPPANVGIGRRILTPGPIWMRVQHKGKDFQVLSSNDGEGWHLWGEASIAMDLTKPILAGLCVTAHMDGSLATATFDNVSVDSKFMQILPGIQVSPAPGAVLASYGGAPGAVGYNIYRRAATDTPDKAVLVNAMPNPYTWFIDDNGGKGLTNGTSYIYQVKAVVKDSSGKMTEGPVSEEASATPQMPLSPGPNAGPNVGSLMAYTIGTDYPGSVTVDSNNVITIKGSGQDIWDVTDQGADLVAPVLGNYMVTAKLLADPTGGDTTGYPSPGTPIAAATPGDAKVGVIIREGLESGSRYAFAFASVMKDPGEFMFEGREDSAEGVNFSGGTTAFASAKFPVWLRLTRIGAMIDGYMSNDGTTFKEIDMPHNYDFIQPLTYAGIAATAHQDGTYVTGMVDGNSLQITPLP